MGPYGLRLTVFCEEDRWCFYGPAVGRAVGQNFDPARSCWSARDGWPAGSCWYFNLASYNNSSFCKNTLMGQHRQNCWMGLQLYRTIARPALVHNHTSTTTTSLVIVGPILFLPPLVLPWWYWLVVLLLMNASSLFCNIKLSFVCKMSGPVEESLSLVIISLED